MRKRQAIAPIGGEIIRGQMICRGVLGLGALLLAACGGESDAPPVPATEAAAGGPLANLADPAAADVRLVLECGAPFTPDATPATLAAVFGRENVIPETVDGPEGTQVNVTAIYPNDPARRIEVVFHNEEERTGLVLVRVQNPESLWTGPGGVRLGDGIAAVEAANGKPFKVMGFGWDYGGFVSDWDGGRLGDKDGCSTAARLLPQASEIADGIVGDGVTPQSNDPDVIKAEPKVTEIGINWAPPR